MSNLDIDLIKCLVHEVSSGSRSYSRDALSYCYFEELKKRGGVETTAVSEKWIDYLWQRIGQVKFEHLASASRSEDRLAKLLMELIGK